MHFSSPTAKRNPKGVTQSAKKLTGMKAVAVTVIVGFFLMALAEAETLLVARLRGHLKS